MVRRVAAVVVHYGDPQRTIRAVLNHWRLGAFSDIVVIANDLRPRPENLENIPCKWLIPSRNLGFGAACQLGAAACPADIYAFFNPHVTIDKISLDHCVLAFDTKNVGIASPYLYHPGSGNPSVDWKYTHCTRTYSRIVRLPVQVPLKRASHDQSIESPAVLIDNDWATGGLVLIRCEVIRDIGWDGSYFLGFEDVDISIRAKKRGWRVVVVPAAIAYHTGESTRTSTTTSYYNMRNSLWFTRRHRSRRIQALLTSYLLLRLCRIAAADVLKRRRPPRARSATRGMLDGWRLCPDNAGALPREPLLSTID